MSGPPSNNLERFRELTTPGRAVNLFESVELEVLEEQFGQPLLPFTTPAPMPKLPKTATTQQLLAPQPGEIVQSGSHRLLVISKTNREHCDPASLQELQDSIKIHGILQPLIVRPNPALPTLAPGEIEDRPGAFELVAGWRRWLCAGKLDLQNVPFIVRPYDDKTALEIQKLENLQREDLDPIEEGRGYRQMMKEFGYTLEDLITRLHRKKSWIYGRIKLAALTPEVVKFWRDGFFGESVALRIARLPAKMQAAFCADAEEDDNGDAFSPENPLTDRQAAALIAEKYMKELKGAPFDVNDADLVPAKFHDDPLHPGQKERVFGGACPDCPHRAGNQPDFDPKAGRADVCLHPACYQAKAEAAFAPIAAAHTTAGGATLSDGMFERVFHAPYHSSDDGIQHDSPVQSGNGSCYDVKLPGKKETTPTLSQVAAHLKITPTLALHPYTLQQVELFDRQAVLAAAKKAGLVARGGGGDTRYKAEQKKAQAEARRKAAIKSHIAAQVFATSIPHDGDDFVRFLVHLATSFANDASADQARAMVKRRGIDTTPFKNGTHGIPARAALNAEPAKLKTEQELHAFLFELASTPRFEGYAADNPLKDACKFLRLDYAKLETKAKATLKEETESKKKSPARQSAKTAPTKPVQTPAPAKSKKRSGLTPEAKARLVAAMKARWAKARANATPKATKPKAAKKGDER